MGIRRAPDFGLCGGFYRLFPLLNPRLFPKIGLWPVDETNFSLWVWFQESGYPLLCNINLNLSVYLVVSQLSILYNIMNLS